MRLLLRLRHRQPRAYARAAAGRRADLARAAELSAARSRIELRPTPTRGTAGTPEPSSTTSMSSEPLRDRRTEHVRASPWRTAFVIASAAMR